MLQAGPLSASSGFSSFNVARYKRGTTSGLPQRKSKPLDKFAKELDLSTKKQVLWIMNQSIDSQYRYDHMTQMCPIISYDKNWYICARTLYHDWSQNISSRSASIPSSMAFSGSLSAWAFNSSAWQLARKRQTGQTGQTFERFSRTPKQPSDSGGHACSSVIFPSKASTSGQELFLSPTKVSFKDQVTKVYKISGTDSMNLWISRTLAIQKRESEPKLW